MKIMYINDVGFDCNNGTNHIIISMLNGFLEEGFDVYYITSHTEGHNEDLPSSLLNNPNFSYDIIKRRQIKKNKLVQRYLSSIIFEYKARKKWKKIIDEIDYVILQSHYTAPTTSKLLKKYNKKVIFNIFDIFPGSSYSASGLPNKLIYRFFLNMEKKIYRNSTYITTLTEDTKKSLLDLGVEEKKIVVVPNWFDADKIHYIDNCQNSFYKEFCTDNDLFYIQYAGSLGVSYNFEMILLLAERFRNNKKIMFQFVGDGLKLTEIKKKVAELRLTNIQFVPWQPIDRLSEVYSSCLLQIVPLRPEIIFNSYPSKVLPLMGCKKTALVFVDRDSFFYNEMNEKKIAFCVSPEGVDEAAEVIEKLLINKSILKEYEDNAYNYVCQRFNSETNIKKIIALFSK